MHRNMPLVLQVNQRRSDLPAWIALIALALFPALTSADSQTVNVDPGQEVLIDLSGNPDDSNDTAVRLKNLSQNPGTVTVEFIPGPPSSGMDGPSLPENFVLVDGTLKVESDIPPGELRARYRIEYVRAEVRRQGIRGRSIRLLRNNLREQRWERATNLLRSSVTPLRVRDQRADFVLGHYGYYRDGRYVWAVMDINSEYAIGGELSGGTPVPGLLPIFLFVAGGGVLLVGFRSLRQAS